MSRGEGGVEGECVSCELGGEGGVEGECVTCEQGRGKQPVRVPSEGSLRRKTALPIVKFHAPSQLRDSRR